MKKYVIIVAGGKGLRMGTDLPKQFLVIAGKPVLMHTLSAFYNQDHHTSIILVLPAEQQEYWYELCARYTFDIPHQIVTGGDTRFQSVKNGLDILPAEGLTAVHDGVRPLTSEALISAAYQAAEKHNAVIPVTDMIESVREINITGQSKSVDRNLYKLVQTPQIFSTGLLKTAYEQPYSPLFTDDASVVESLGKTVTLIPGDRLNIKLTTPTDIWLAEAILTHV